MRSFLLIITIGMFMVSWAKAQEKSGCEPASQEELSKVGSSGQHGKFERDFFDRKESPKRTACRLAETKLVEKALGNRKDPCLKGEQVELKTSIEQKIQLNQGVEFESVGGGYFFHEGCKAHDCGVKAFTLFDSAGNNGVVGILECNLNDDLSAPATKDRDNRQNKYVYLYSSFDNEKSFPSQVMKKIDSWIELQQESERRWFKKRTFSRAFVKK